MPRTSTRSRRAPADQAQSSAVAVVEQQPRAIALIKEELEKREHDLLAVLPPGMDPKRFARVSLLAVAKNPDLLTCTPGSIIRSVIEAAEVGLEPTGMLNRAWLVPFRNEDSGKKEAQLMIGYQGYADLMRDGDSRRRVVAEVVYEGDHFKVIKGTEEPRIEHEPAFQTEDPAKITYAYAIIFYPDGTNQFEVMTRQQVELIRAKSRQRNGPTWTQNWAQMARKTALRRLSNYTPLTARAIEAIARDDEREFGGAAPSTGHSRTAEVRDRILGRNRPAEPVQDAPGAAEQATVDDDATSAPSASADQQTDGQDAAEGEAREVCGAAGTEIAEGEVCNLPPGHEGRVHKSASASWPVA